VAFGEIDNGKGERGIKHSPTYILKREEGRDATPGVTDSNRRELPLEEERRSSERNKLEMPVSVEIGRNTFFGTTANLSDDGMMIESSLAHENVRRIFKVLLKADECPVRVNYSVKGKSFSRPGRIKHFLLDCSGGRLACRFSFGVWIPKLRMRDDQWL
jgi:hypothetical protein